MTGHWLMKPFKWLGRFWTGPIEAARLKVFEKAFTASFLYYFFVARFVQYREWLTPEGYHFSRRVHWTYLPEPYALLEPWAALLLGVVTLAAGLLVLAGKFSRAGLGVLFGVAVYIHGADPLGSFALNHHYIAGFLILFLAPPIRPAAEPGGHAVLSSAWPVRTLQATILLQIFTAGMSKVLHGNWMNFQDVIWSQSQGLYRNELASWLLMVAPMWCWTVLQYLALGFELVGPLLLVLPWTRRIGLAGGLGFVLFIATTMNDLTYFMAQLLSYLTLFLSVKELDWMKAKAQSLLRPLAVWRKSAATPT